MATKSSLSNILVYRFERGSSGLCHEVQVIKKVVHKSHYIGPTGTCNNGPLQRHEYEWINFCGNRFSVTKIAENDWVHRNHPGENITYTLTLSSEDFAKANLGKS